MTNVEYRYTPHHIGADGAGLGGIFDIDSNSVRQGFRFTAPHGFTPEAIWIYCAAENLGTQGVRVRFASATEADPYQPTLAGNSIRWIPDANTAAGWQRIELEVGGTSLKTYYGPGSVIHVTFERQTGTFSGTDRLRMYTARSRFPLHYTHTARAASGEPVFDRYNAFMRTPDTADAAQPYAQQRDNNASFHPIFLVECSDAPNFGNPFDQHIEDTIYSNRTFSHTVRLPQTLNCTFVSMFVRGAGTAGGVHNPSVPQGPCYLSIYNRQLPGLDRKIIRGPDVLIDPDDRLFVSRSHWFGRWLNPPLQIVGDSTEYTFELSAPGCSLASTRDGYLICYDTTTLPQSVAVDFRSTDSYATFTPGSIGRRADTGLILRDNATQTSLGVIDEVLAPLSGTWPMYLAEAGTYELNVLVRNIGIGTAAGGAIWSRIVDADTGATLSAIQSHAALDANDEIAVTHSFPMPATDVHMLVQCGHYEGATPVQDDEALNECRVIP